MPAGDPVAALGRPGLCPNRVRPAKASGLNPGQFDDLYGPPAATAG